MNRYRISRFLKIACISFLICGISILSSHNISADTTISSQSASSTNVVALPGPPDAVVMYMHNNGLIHANVHTDTGTFLKSKVNISTVYFEMAIDNNNDIYVLPFAPGSPPPSLYLIEQNNPSKTKILSTQNVLNIKSTESFHDSKMILGKRSNKTVVYMSFVVEDNDPFSQTKGQAKIELVEFDGKNFKQKTVVPYTKNLLVANDISVPFANIGADTKEVQVIYMTQKGINNSLIAVSVNKAVTDVTPQTWKITHQNNIAQFIRGSCDQYYYKNDFLVYNDKQPLANNQVLEDTITLKYLKDPNNPVTGSARGCLAALSNFGPLSFITSVEFDQNSPIHKNLTGFFLAGSHVYNFVNLPKPLRTSSEVRVEEVAVNKGFVGVKSDNLQTDDAYVAVSVGKKFWPGGPEASLQLIPIKDFQAKAPVVIEKVTGTGIFPMYNIRVETLW